MRLKPGPRALSLMAAAGLAAAGLVAQSPTATAGGSVVYIDAGLTSALESHPSDHHRTENFKASGKYFANWAADYRTAAGTAVHARFDGPKDLKFTVQKIAASCSTGGGGKGVQIAVSQNGKKTGAVAYVHLANITVQEGQTISNNTKIGEVGDGYGDDPNCWTGPHLHVEAYNVSDKSCYYAPSTTAPGTNIGRLGGSDVKTEQTAC